MDISFQKFEELLSKGYSLDLLYILKSCENSTYSPGNIKVDILYKTALRKQLISDDDKLTLEGKELLEFLSKQDATTIVKKKHKNEDFDNWWKAYPSTDTFTYKGKKFIGTRALKAKKEDCKLKLEKILGEGEFTLSEMIAALEYEVNQKKENSIKTGQNKLSYMQNSLTYLNQKTYESFIELIREGNKITESNTPSGGVDI